MSPVREPIERDLPQPAFDGILGGLFNFLQPPRNQIAPITGVLESNSTPPSAVTADTPAASGPDPVLQALLQQLEYTKQSATTIPASQVSKVTLQGQQSGGNSALVLVVLVVVVIGGFLVFAKGGKKKEKGGATKVESDH